MTILRFASLSLSKLIFPRGPNVELIRRGVPEAWGTKSKGLSQKFAVSCATLSVLRERGSAAASRNMHDTTTQVFAPR